MFDHVILHNLYNVDRDRPAIVVRYKERSVKDARYKAITLQPAPVPTSRGANFGADTMTSGGASGGGAIQGGDGVPGGGTGIPGNIERFGRF